MEFLFLQPKYTTLKHFNLMLYKKFWSSNIKKSTESWLSCGKRIFTWIDFLGLYYEFE